MIHLLKILPMYYVDIVTEVKTFEVRKKDRDYRVGDFLALREYDITNCRYTGRDCLCLITYILDDDKFCKDGYVVLGIKYLFPHVKLPQI